VEECELARLGLRQVRTVVGLNGEGLPDQLEQWHEDERRQHHGEQDAEEAFRLG
jgi:hypothetical protein